MWEVIKHQRIACHDCECRTTIADMRTIYLGYTVEFGGDKIMNVALACQSCWWDRIEAGYDD